MNALCSINKYLLQMFRTCMSTKYTQYSGNYKDGDLKILKYYFLLCIHIYAYN